jgi:hypothetical protein
LTLASSFYGRRCCLRCRLSRARVGPGCRAGNWLDDFPRASSLRCSSHLVFVSPLPIRHEPINRHQTTCLAPARGTSALAHSRRLFSNSSPLGFVQRTGFHSRSPSLGPSVERITAKQQGAGHSLVPRPPPYPPPHHTVAGIPPLSNHTRTARLIALDFPTRQKPAPSILH